MSDLADFTKNVLPFLSQLEEDEAGPDPSEISRRYGISEESIVMLSRNENPYGPIPHLCAALKDVPLHRYPDSRPFVKALSGYTGYPEECLVAGAGMDEIITTICRIFLGAGDKALIPVPTYNFYGLAVELCGALPHYQARLSGFAARRFGQPAGTLCNSQRRTGTGCGHEEPGGAAGASRRPALWP